jgi:threonine aldolase
MKGQTLVADAVIDLRSDTVTKPTDSMRRAMASAEVGDDVYGEDPTVNRLEALAAEMLGKEAAVFVSSGTMGNLISVLSHCGRGDEIILGDQSHIFHYEQGGVSGVGSVHPHTVPNQPDGTLRLEDIRRAIRPDDEHDPVTRLVALENTHNRCGGRVLKPEYVDAVGALAHDRGLLLHIDGARLWNAAVALGEPPARLVAAADSVSVCLSKGLAAPVGSVVAGSGDFIRRARRNRKLLGGGMRQAGVIAAAGIVALSEMIDRLAEDHANARLLAQGLSDMEGIFVDVGVVETNMVVVTVQREGWTAEQVASELARRCVLLNALDERRMRIVTNYHVTAGDIERVLEAFEGVLGLDEPVISGGAYIYG